LKGGQHCQNDSGKHKKRGVSMPGIGGQDERNEGSACSGIYTNALELGKSLDEMVLMVLDFGLHDDAGAISEVADTTCFLN